MAQKIETGTIAKRYATALLQQSIEAKNLDVVIKDVDALRNVLLSSEEFSRIVKNPALSKRDAKKALINILEAMGVSNGVKGLATVLSENRRAFALAATLDAFKVLVNEHKGIVKAEVISAAELSDDQKASVAIAVEKVVGTQVEIVYSVDSSIIGGLIVKVGSKMLDASIQTKLEKLKLEMKGA